MYNTTIELALWSTASYRPQSHPSHQELSALKEHLASCALVRGKLFNLRCEAEFLQSFLAARVVTCLSVIALMLGVMAISV